MILYYQMTTAKAMERFLFTNDTGGVYDDVDQMNVIYDDNDGPVLSLLNYW